LNCHWKPPPLRPGLVEVEDEEDEEDVFGEDGDPLSGLLFTLDFSAQCLWRTQLDPPDLE